MEARTKTVITVLFFIVILVGIGYGASEKSKNQEKTLQQMYGEADLDINVTNTKGTYIDVDIYINGTKWTTWNNIPPGATWHNTSLYKHKLTKGFSEPITVSVKLRGSNETIDSQTLTVSSLSFYNPGTGTSGKSTYKIQLYV
jgi:hypothetical protein